MVELMDRVKRLPRHDPPLPLPGGGNTGARHRVLLEWGRADLSLARIAEAHSDALAILAEAGRTAQTSALYGVWASEAPNGRVTAVGGPAAGWTLHGIKQYCSGASFVTSALVTARSDAGILLFDVPIDHPGIEILKTTWRTPAFADTATGPVAFHQVTVGADALVGSPDWYLTRPGFWHGAIGPAACWAGGALSLVDAAQSLPPRDCHSRAHVGAMLASAWGMEAVLDQAAREIDADPPDNGGQARVRALKVRHLIERWCTDILDRFGRATGPQLLAYDDQVIRQHMGLGVYLRQCHGERDLETIQK